MVRAAKGGVLGQLTELMLRGELVGARFTTPGITLWSEGCGWGLRG
jgi:hypothetical protein